MGVAFEISGRSVGPGRPPFVVAEMSANHNQSFERAVEIIHAAKKAGADAIKFQTYTPETLTIDCDRAEFRIGDGTPWAGRRLFELYEEAQTPWQWQPKLAQVASDLDLIWFSTPFDCSAVDFLEEMNAPAYKISSFEAVDLALLRRVAATGRPVIVSTGMCSLDEIEDVVTTVREAGGHDLALLKCTSAYPAKPNAMNLRTIADLAERFRLPIGLSDHTLGTTAAVAAVALGACIIEKHLTISRTNPGLDSPFSLEPAELADLVRSVRLVHEALGEPSYSATESEAGSRIFRRSLFVVRDLEEGEVLTRTNVRAIRPGYGLMPKHLERVLGRRAARSLQRGEPLAWSDIE